MEIWTNPMKVRRVFATVKVHDTLNKKCDRDILAVITYRGRTFYWNDYSQPSTRKRNFIRGVTDAASGRVVLETEATRLEDVTALLRSRLELHWDIYLRQSIKFAQTFSADTFLLLL